MSSFLRARSLCVFAAAVFGAALIISQLHSGRSSAATQPRPAPVQASQYDLVSNAAFVLGPTARSFDLKGYLQEVGSPLLIDADLIESWCAYASINPQVVLALLETDGAQVSRGWRDDMTPEGRAEFVRGFVLDLAARFYAHLYASGERAAGIRQPAAVRFPDGASLPLDAAASSGTFAILQSLAQSPSAAAYTLAPGPEVGADFAVTWNRLFPDADRLDATLAITPDGAPPADFLQFPFPVGQRWWFNGAHNWNGSGVTYGKPYSSIDFFTSADSCSAPPTGDWTVAAAAGKGYHPNGAGCWYRIDHASGWTTSYYHLRNTAANGQVAANAPLGTIACETCVGGFASGPHVHFSLLYNGAYVDLEGVVLSGWTVHSGKGDYNSGSLERNGVQLKPYASVLNEGVKPAATATPTPAVAPTRTATAAPTLTPTPAAPVSARFLYPKAKDLLRTCPVTLVADASAPPGGQVRFLVRQGSAVVDVGGDRNGADGWQILWDCQAMPEGAATLSLSVLDAGGREVLRDVSQTAVTLSKKCNEGTYRTAFFANTNLAGAPASSWCKASAISYNWGAAGPGAGVPGADNFSARFRGNWRYAGGPYRFKVQADDGVRVWIDRVLVLDEWRDHNMTTGMWEFVQVLPAGLHEVWLDYYERSGSAGAILSWTRGYGGAGGDGNRFFLPLIVQ